MPEPAISPSAASHCDGSNNVMPRMKGTPMRCILLVPLAVLVLAGCGAAAKTYGAGSTETCLQSHGLVVSRGDADYIAQAAVNGSYTVTVGATTVNMSFYRNHDDAGDGLTAYRSLGDISDAKLYSSGNTVFAWDDTPLPSEKSAVDGCLSS